MSGVKLRIRDIFLYMFVDICISFCTLTLEFLCLLGG